MPPLPVIAHTYRVALIWSGVGGTNPVNVMHFRDTAGTSNAADLAARLDAAMGPDNWNCLTSSSLCGLLKITPLDGTSPTTDHATTSANWTGEQSGQYLPQVACVVKLNTALRGRSHRGRVFIGPVAEAIDSDGFYVSGPGQGNMQTAWEGIETALAAHSWELVVASYKLGSAQSVTSLVVETALATQRRRQSRLR